MLFEHASYAFPSEWIILLDALLTLAVALLLWLRPQMLARPARALGRRARRLALGPRSSLVALLVLGAAGTGVLIAIHGPPLARIPDEKSYLLAADTFAHGRLANPSHPAHEHFVTAHVLHEPIYASKYPPAQGMLLALGQGLTGHPAAGLVLSSALLCWAIGWALAATLPAPWPLIGGLLALLRFAVGSYWNQSYWGGSIAAIGGALVLGALLRLPTRAEASRAETSRARIGHALFLVTGLALLAHSRPVEGLSFAIGAAGILFWSWSRCRPTRGVLLTLVFGNVLIIASIVGYNLGVTGRALTFPHQLHASQFPEYVHFVWQLGPGWPAETAALWGRKLAFTFYFFLGTGPILALLLMSRTVIQDRAARIAIILSFMTLLALMPIRPYHAHYPAPLAAALVLLAVLALRALATCRWRGHLIGPAAVTAIFAIQLASFLHQTPAHRPDATDWARQRAEIHQQLLASPGQDLLLVDYPNGRPDSWVWNDADLDASEVVWAESLGETRDRELIAQFANRRVWRIDASFGPERPPLREIRP